MLTGSPLLPDTLPTLRKKPKTSLPTNSINVSTRKRTTDVVDIIVRIVVDPLFCNSTLVVEFVVFRNTQPVSHSRML